MQHQHAFGAVCIRPSVLNLRRFLDACIGTDGLKICRVFEVCIGQAVLKILRIFLALMVNIFRDL